MSIENAISLENSKNPNELILIKDGSWWRAYEESAYMCRLFAKDLDEKDPERCIAQSINILV